MEKNENMEKEVVEVTPTREENTNFMDQIVAALDAQENIARVNPQQAIKVSCPTHGDQIATLVLDLPNGYKALFCTQCLFERLYAMGINPTAYIQLDKDIPVDYKGN